MADNVTLIRPDVRPGEQPLDPSVALLAASIALHKSTAALEEVSCQLRVALAENEILRARLRNRQGRSTRI